MSLHHVPWMNTVSLALEQILGPKGAIVILVVVLAALWFVRRTPVDAIAVVGITGFGWVYSLIFKYAVHRQRPDQSLLAIQPLDPQEDDTLMDELLSSNPKFQALVTKSKRSPRKPFLAADQGLTNG